MKPQKYLNIAAETYDAKSKVYGDNYKMIGKVLEALFPDGLKLKGEDDFNRFHLFLLSLVKKTRYAVNFDDGGHEDSVLDDIVYLAMLQEVDADANATFKTSGKKKDNKDD